VALRQAQGRLSDEQGAAEASVRTLQGLSPEAPPVARASKAGRRGQARPGSVRERAGARSVTVKRSGPRAGNGPGMPVLQLRRLGRSVLPCRLMFTEDLFCLDHAAPASKPKKAVTLEGRNKPGASLSINESLRRQAQFNAIIGSNSRKFVKLDFRKTS
jgi:hypothetical protein